MWADVNALEKIISKREKERSKQRVKSSFNEIEQETASLTDEEFTRLERMIMERRGRAAAHVVVAPNDTAQPCNPRSSSKISFNVRVYMEGSTKSRMDPEPGQLESSSAGTGEVESSSAGTGQLESPSAGTCFETPGQQCLPNWDMGRTTIDGCLLVGASSNLGGNIFSLEEPVCKKMRCKPEDNGPASEENKQFDPGG